MAGLIFDSQFDERHGVLRNTRGLTDHAALEDAIASQSFLRVLELEKHPIIGHLDIAHLRKIHHFVFQDIFPWAGHFREVRTSRSDSFGFPPPQFILPSLEKLFADLKAEKHLKGLDADTFATRSAFYLGELNAIHPFREGNGRTQREFIRTVALTAGHKLSWHNLDQQENNEASRLSYSKGDTSALARIIRSRLRPE